MRLVRLMFGTCAVLAFGCLGAASGQEQKGAEAFPKAIEREIGGKNVKLVKTGQAVRKRLIFSVYSVACYVQEGAKIRTAQEMISADCPKVLHLIMLRDVTGKSMSESLLTILRQNHPAPAFAAEAKSLKEKLIASNAEYGDHIWITHIPKVGLHFERTGGEDVFIRDVEFSKALWENYFGKHNAGEEVKSGLLSLVVK